MEKQVITFVLSKISIYRMNLIHIGQLKCWSFVRIDLVVILLLYKIIVSDSYGMVNTKDIKWQRYTSSQ